MCRYSMIKNRVNNSHKPRNSCYAGVSLKVGREEFINWFMPLDYKGCSVDRVDNDGDYELSNMQVIPLIENMRKDRIKAQDGFCECYSCLESKPLEMFAKHPRRKTGRSTICKRCDSKRKKKTGTGK